MPGYVRAKRLPVRRRSHLHIHQILSWADAHYARTGHWPNINSGRIPGTDEWWDLIDNALRLGFRGLPRDSRWSLARLLAEHRGLRNTQDLPPLTIELILSWVDAYHMRTGQWPNEDSGPVPEAPGETWRGIDYALRRGSRSLPRASLPQLLAKHRGVRNKHGLPPFRISQILTWADAHRRMTGAWPTKDSGAIADAPGETWLAVDAALRGGMRGLAGGSSLAMLLEAKRGVRNIKNLPPLSIPKILRWCDAYRKRTGSWPHSECGEIPEADVPGETWRNVANALRLGLRGLPGGSSLAQLLAEERGHRNRKRLVHLSQAQILRWCRAWKRRTGKWPTSKSGPIPEAPGETWSGVSQALYKGLRGLPGRSSLARLISQDGESDRHRGKPARDRSR